MIQTSRQQWSSQTKLIVTILLLVVFFYLFYQFSEVIPPMVIAVILAYVLSPLTNWLQKFTKGNRGIATGIVYLLLLVVAITLPMVVIPPVMSQLKGLNLDIQRMLFEAENLFGHDYYLAGQVINGAEVLKQVVSNLEGMLEPFFGHTLGFAVGVISSLIWVIFVLIVSFYLVKDYPSITIWLDKLPPSTYASDFKRLRKEVNTIWSAFFRGQLMLALIMACIITSLGFVLGLRFALALGVLAGLLEFLPSIGHGIWLALASLIALFGGSTWLPIPNWSFAILLIGLHIIVQQTDLNYLIPRIIGRSVHLSPLVVILGIVAGASIAGVLGIALAAPTIATLRVIGRYTFASLINSDPFSGKPVPDQIEPNPRWWRKWWNKVRPYSKS